MDAQGHVMRVANSVAVSVLLLGALGCADTEPPLGPTVLSAWEGTLAPVISTEPDGNATLITGNIGALVRQSGTEVGVGLQEFENPDLLMDWGLHSGRCDVPGALLGAPEGYPQLSAAKLEANAVIEQQLVEGDAYYVSVTDAGTGEEVACGNLSQTEL